MRSRLPVIATVAAVVVLAAIAAAYAGMKANDKAILARTASAVAALQAQLDNTFTSGATKVNQVSMVRAGSARYTGAATVAVLGDHPVIVNFTAATDSKATIVRFDAGEIEKIGTTLQAELASLGDAMPDVIFQSRFLSLFPKELKRDQDKLKERLSVVTPVEDRGNVFFGSGCKAHACNVDNAAWVVDKRTGHLTAAIIHIDLGRAPSDKVNVNVELYGRPAGRTDMPASLQMWVNEQAEAFQDTPPELLEAMRGLVASR